MWKVSTYKNSPHSGNSGYFKDMNDDDILGRRLLINIKCKYLHIGILKSS